MNWNVSHYMDKSAVKIILSSFFLITECEKKELENLHILNSVSMQEKIKASASSQHIKIYILKTDGDFTRNNIWYVEDLPLMKAATEKTIFTPKIQLH